MASRQLLGKFWRVTTGALGVTAISSSAYFLYRNDFDIAHLGIVRLTRAAFYVCMIAIDYKWTLRKFDNTQSENYQELLKKVHLRSAKKLLTLCGANGGCFIKVGQHCGSLEYLLPKEYTETLSALHSKAPETGFDAICRVVEYDLARKVDDIFIDFDDRPLGAASLAQVYKARLRSTGEVVAVKIQHPYVKGRSMVDIATMDTLARIVNRLFPEFKLMWLVEEMRRNLPVELDFIHEGRCAERVKRMLAHLHWLRIPKIYWEYSTDRVLTMEYCEGGQINDKQYMLARKIDAQEVCDKLGIVYTEMIFKHGYVHCDPHPGNVLVHRNPQNNVNEIILLDHGLYTDLSEEFRVNYSHLWLAIIKADLNGIKYYSDKMGVGNLYGLFACMLAARSWKSITGGDVSKRPPTTQEEKEIQLYVGSLVAQISEVLDRIPKPLILIFKTNDLLRGIEHTLGTGHDSRSFIRMTKSCMRTIAANAMLRCDSWFIWMRIWSWLQMSLFRLWLYEMYLSWSNRLSTVFLAQKISL